MSASELFKKYSIKRNAIATVAIPATTHSLNKEISPTVAKIATLAVATPPEIKRTPLPEEEEEAIRKWLASINEVDQEAIDNLLEQCQIDMLGKRYLLEEAAKISTPEVPDPDYRATCGACRHFKRINHPTFGRHLHLGHCNEGEPEAISGLWDDSKRWCSSFNALE